MPTTIDKVKIQEYRDSIIHLAQQGDARIRPFVTEVSSNAEFYNWDRLASTEAVKRTKTVRNKETLVVDDVFSRRVSTPQVWEHNFTFEDYDKAEMAINPQSAYAENQGMAMKRAYDSLIVEAASGTALDGDGTANALPATSKVGDGTTDIGFGDIAKIQKMFMDQDVFIDVPKVAIIGPAQAEAFLKLTENTSSDYVHRETLQRLTATGIVPNWMGFTWVVSNLLHSGGAGKLDCLFFTKRALGLQVNMNMKIRVTENPDKSYDWNVFSQFSAGCVRIEDEQIVVGTFKDA